MIPLRAGLVVATLVMAGAAPAVAQSAVDLYDWDVGRAQLSRQALEQLRDRLDDAARSSAYSERLRGQSRLMAAAIRQRLTDGDFRVGDRIHLKVTGTTNVSDTLVVGAARVLTVQGYPPLSLAGVLRSELQPTLARELSQVERGVVVEARSLVRIAVLGHVGRPGYYVVPSERLVENVIMVAGGPASTATVEKIRIERAGRPLWEGELLQRAIAEGQTLDALNVRDGDVINMPGTSQRNWDATLRAFYAIVSLPAALYGISRIFF